MARSIAHEFSISIMGENMEFKEKLDYIKRFDPEGAARLERLLNKEGALKEGNIYGERFTDRQVSLVFKPLIEAAYSRARILEALSPGANTIYGISGSIHMAPDEVFNHMKELMRKNMVEVEGHEGRDAVFRRRV
ncbi:MAG: hypothetical protein N2745_06670 [Syntrophorhabdaceae bacterium]|nr:hypothetical protein [Syntrophorhabdaceae bacterium]